MTPAWFCQKCHAEIGQIIIMVTVDNDHSKCPRCKTEVWPDYDAPELGDDEDMVSVRTDPSSTLISRSLPEGYRIPPGGSKSGKRAKKKGTKTFDDNGFCG